MGRQDIRLSLSQPGSLYPIHSSTPTTLQITAQQCPQGSHSTPPHGREQRTPLSCPRCTFILSVISRACTSHEVKDLSQGWLYLVHTGVQPLPYKAQAQPGPPCILPKTRVMGQTPGTLSRGNL